MPSERPGQGWLSERSWQEQGGAEVPAPWYSGAVFAKQCAQVWVQWVEGEYMYETS